MSADTEVRIAALERTVARLQRRLGAPFSLGRSTLAPADGGAVQLVQAQLDALSTRDSVPVLYHFGFTAAAPAGCDLHVAYLDGDRSRAVIIASGHQSYRMRGLGLGDAALYDIRGASLWLAAGGPTVACAGQPMTIQGDLHVTGQVIAGYGGADQVGLQSHDHPEGTGTTGAPNAGT